MVVQNAVLREAALVQAARDHGFVLRGHAGDHVVGGAVGILHANVPIIAAEALAEHIDVAAKGEHGAFAARFTQDADQVVGDEPLRDASQIKHSLRVAERHRGAVDLHTAVIDVLDRLLDGRVVGLHADHEVPKARHGANGDVEQAVGSLRVLKRGRNALRGFGRNLDRRAGCMVDVPDVGTLDGARELVLEILATLS